jgi:hypothetical protein
MSSRFVISILCVGAVAFACGPRTHNEAAKSRSAGSTRASTAAKVVRQQGTPKATPSDKAPLTANLYVHASESRIRLAFNVSNTGSKRLELTFPSGQTYDFVIVDSVGREVWRWAEGRMFTQAVRNKLLSAGDALELEESWSPALMKPGRYTARAVLTSQNFPLTRQAEFRIEATTVASR